MLATFRAYKALLSLATLPIRSVSCYLVTGGSFGLIWLSCKMGWLLISWLGPTTSRFEFLFWFYRLFCG